MSIADRIVAAWPGILGLAMLAAILYIAWQVRPDSAAASYDAVAQNAQIAAGWACPDGWQDVTGQVGGDGVVRVCAFVRAGAEGTE